MLIACTKSLFEQWNDWIMFLWFVWYEMSVCEWLEWANVWIEWTGMIRCLFWSSLQPLEEKEHVIRSMTENVSQFVRLIVKECIDRIPVRVWSLNFERKVLVFRRFGDPFAAHDQNQRVVVSWRGAQSNFPTSIVGTFSL